MRSKRRLKGGLRLSRSGSRLSTGVPFKNLVQKSARVRIGGRLNVTPNGPPKARFEHRLTSDRRECLKIVGTAVHSKCLVRWKGLNPRGR